MRISFMLAIGVIAVASNVQAASIGVTRQAEQVVSGTLNGQKRTIVTATEVFENERLTANAQGNAQIELKDGTKIVVGPNANVVLDNFVYKADNTIGSLTVRATKGAFRFISGRSGHAAYKVVTPYATIGIRGTAFDVTVQKGGTYVALLQGAVNVCKTKGKCKLLDDRCDYVFVGAKGFSDQKSVAGGSRKSAREIFPLLANQNRLLASFRQSTASCSSFPMQASLNPAPAPNAVIDFTPAPAPSAGPGPAASPGPAAPDPQPGPTASPGPSAPDPTPEPEAPQPSPGNPGNDKSVGNSPFGGENGDVPSGKNGVGNGGGKGRGNNKG
jgi:hypothetical protein